VLQTAHMDELKTLREELARCEKECDEAKRDTRASHARLSAVLIRLGRAQRAIEDYEAAKKERGE
jgi:hypothetical protein